MVSIDGMLYFTADVDSEAEAGQNSSGLALLKSDGTAAGTKPLKTFQSINDLVNVDGELYFIADDGTGSRLWRSDGTARGTVLVKDLVILERARTVLQRSKTPLRSLLRLSVSSVLFLASRKKSLSLL